MGLGTTRFNYKGKFEGLNEWNEHSAKLHFFLSGIDFVEIYIIIYICNRWSSGAATVRRDTDGHTGIEGEDSAARRSD